MEAMGPAEQAGNLEFEATAVESAEMPVTQNQSDNEPGRDEKTPTPQQHHSASAEECSHVEIEMVRRLVAHKRYDDARELVMQLRDAREGSDTLELLLSEVYIAESRLSDATACVMALLGKNPENPATLQALVKLYRSSGDVAKALEVRCLWQYEPEWNSDSYDIQPVSALLRMCRPPGS